MNVTDFVTEVNFPVFLIIYTEYPT